MNYLPVSFYFIFQITMKGLLHGLIFYDVMNFNSILKWKSQTTIK